MGNSERKPELIIIAGPNGSGKTSITQKFLHHEWAEGTTYINPDQVAKDMFGDWNNSEAVLKAANYCTELREKCLAEKRSFVFETVFSAQDKIDFVLRAKKAGFFIRIFFISTSDPSINAARIAQRVMKGGHDVPITKIISRYNKSIQNCNTVSSIVDRLYVYDNSVDNEDAKALFRLSSGHLVKQYETNIPEWAQFLIGYLILEDISTQELYKRFLTSVNSLMKSAMILHLYPSLEHRLLELRKNLWKYWQSLERLKLNLDEPSLHDKLNFIIGVYKTYYDNVSNLLEHKSLYTLDRNGYVESIIIEDDNAVNNFYDTTKNIRNTIRLIRLHYSSLNKNTKDHFIEELETIHQNSYETFRRYKIDYCSHIGSIYSSINTFDNNIKEHNSLLPLVLRRLKDEYSQYTCNRKPSSLRTWGDQMLPIIEDLNLAKKQTEKLTLMEFLLEGKSWREMFKFIYKTFFDFYEHVYDEKLYLRVTE